MNDAAGSGLLELLALVAVSAITASMFVTAAGRLAGAARLEAERALVVGLFARAHQQAYRLARTVSVARGLPTETRCTYLDRTGWAADSLAGITAVIVSAGNKGWASSFPERR